MRPARHLHFVFWYALRDLFERNAWGTTLVNAFTVAVLLAFTLVVYALAEGFKEVRLAGLRRDPLVLCLWLKPQTFGQRIPTARLDRLRAALPAKLPAADGFVGCYPFQHIELDWNELVNGQPVGAALPLKGRTLAPGDPLLDSCRFHSGGPFATPDQPGVIVAPKMLEALREREAAARTGDVPAPAKLRVRVPGSAKTVEVAVVGVLDNPLPLRHVFILTEAFEAGLRQRGRRAKSVFTGPVPADWDPTRLPPDLQRYFQGARLLEAEPDEHKHHNVWVLTSRAEPVPSELEWVEHLKAIQGGMAQAGHAAAADAFLDDLLLRNPEEGSPRPPGYPYLGLYLRDLQDIKHAADGLQALNESEGLGIVPADEDMVARIEGIYRSSSRLLYFLTVVVLAVAGQALFNMVVIQQMRSRQKVTEIGMLKAMGMSSQLMRHVYLAEAFILWLVGGLVALGLVAWLSRAVPPWLMDDPEEQKLLFHLDGRFVVVLLGFSLGTYLAATLFATGRARRAPPMESLSRD